MEWQREIGGNWDKKWDCSGNNLQSLLEEIWDDHIGLIQTDYYGITINLANKAKWILEAGCGIGRWVKYLQDMGLKVVGTDICDSLTRCWSDCQLRCVRGDIRKLPFRDQQFDLILSWGVLEHFQDKKQVVVSLKESWRILRWGGRMLITIPYMNTLNIIKEPYRFIKDRLRRPRISRMLFGKKTPYISDYAPASFLEYKYLRREFDLFLRKSGFEIESAKPISHEFGLLSSLPWSVFCSGPKTNKFTGLSPLGKLVARFFKRVSPWLTNHQILLVCKKAKVNDC